MSSCFVDSEGKIIPGTVHPANDYQAHLTTLWDLFYRGYKIDLEEVSTEGVPCCTAVRNLAVMVIMTFDLLNPEIKAEILEDP